jgi:hypothetical protein
MLMMVSVLVSAATIDSAIAHHGNVASGEEVVTQGPLAFAEAHAEQRDADQVNGNDCEIEGVQAHVLI